LLDLLGEFLHRSPGYGATFAAFQRMFRLVHGVEDFCARAFAFFPQGESLMDSLLIPKTSRFNSLPDEDFL
jgi:hypothetical protein